MIPQTFETVWFLPSENRWRKFNVLAYRDAGTLTVPEKSLEFRGGKESLTL